MKEIVSITKCGQYDKKEVELAIRECLTSFGGMANFVKKGDKVLIKPNFIMKKNPDFMATTHPVFIEAVVDLVHEAGGIAVIAESPGGIYNENVLKGLYKICGADTVAQHTGCKLNFDTSYENVSFKEGYLAKTFPIIKPILEADVIINLPKIKTHTMTGYTGAVKNLFGVIPGAYKAEYHFRIQEKSDFCTMLLDLCRLVKPTISIMDAICGMEGNGPTSGTPRRVGAIIASANPYSLDLVASSIIGFDVDEVFTLCQAVERQLTAPLDEIDVVGQSIESLKVADYKRADGSEIDFLERAKWVPETIRNALNTIIAPKPVFDLEKCVGCGECGACCPAKAIKFVNKKPVVDMKKCIRCFCCQELCPKKAVYVKRNRVVNKIINS